MGQIFQINLSMSISIHFFNSILEDFLFRLILINIEFISIKFISGGVLSCNVRFKRERERKREEKKIKFYIQFKNLKIKYVEKVKISKIIALLMKMIILDLIFRF